MSNFGKDLIRSPDVVDELGQTLSPLATWKVKGGLRAKEVSGAIELYADAPGSSIKGPVRCASTINVNTASPGASIDGVTLVAGDRVLLKNQTTGSQNGIYVFATAGTPLVRSDDFDETAEVKSGLLVEVQEGSQNADTLWMLTTNAPITLGSTALTFELFGLTMPQGSDTTTDATPKAITLYIPPANSSTVVTVLIVGKRDSDGLTVGYVRTATFKAIAGVLTLEGAVSTPHTGENAALAAADATLSTDAVRIQALVTGIAGTNMTWRARVVSRLDAAW